VLPTFEQNLRRVDPGRQVQAAMRLPGPTRSHPPQPTLDDRVQHAVRGLPRAGEVGARRVVLRVEGTSGLPLVLTGASRTLSVRSGGSIPDGAHGSNRGRVAGDGRLGDGAPCFAVTLPERDRTDREQRFELRCRLCVLCGGRLPLHGRTSSAVSPASSTGSPYPGHGLDEGQPCGCPGCSPCLPDAPGCPAAGPATRPDLTHCGAATDGAHARVVLHSPHLILAF